MLKAKNAYLVLTGSGTLLVLTSHKSIMDRLLLMKLKSKGITKFMAFEIAVEATKAKYGGHFDVVVQDLSETDDLRVLDFDGQRAFRLFSFRELGAPIYYDESETTDDTTTKAKKPSE